MLPLSSLVTEHKTWLQKIEANSNLCGDVPSDGEGAQRKDLDVPLAQVAIGMAGGGGSTGLRSKFTYIMTGWWSEPRCL